MIRFFPYGFSSLVSCDHLVKPSTRCTAKSHLLEFALTVRNIMEPLPRIPCPILPDLHAGCFANQPRANQRQQRDTQVAGWWHIWHDFPISDSCYCLLVTYHRWRIHGEGSSMIWWFDVCFFWIQKWWIQQLKASSVATEYWDRLQRSVCGYKLASLEIVGFIAF